MGIQHNGLMRYLQYKLNLVSEIIGHSLMFLNQKLNELVRFFKVMVCYGYAVITNKKNWLLRLLQMIKNWLNFYKKRRTNRQKQRKRSKRKLKVKRQWNMFLMKLKFWENENFLYPIDGVIAPSCLIRALVICFCKD